MKRNNAALFLNMIKSLLIKALRGSFLLFITSFYFLSVSQATTFNQQTTAEAITITHSHTHHDVEDEQDHDDDEHDHDHHHEEESHQKTASDDSSAHSHTFLILTAPAAYTTPTTTLFVGVTVINSGFCFCDQLMPPLDPGLGSIFRPPISA